MLGPQSLTFTLPTSDPQLRPTAWSQGVQRRWGTGLPQGFKDHPGGLRRKADQDSAGISPPVPGRVASCLGLWDAPWVRFSLGNEVFPACPWWGAVGGLATLRPGKLTFPSLCHSDAVPQSLAGHRVWGLVQMNNQGQLPKGQLSWREPAPRAHVHKALGPTASPCSAPTPTLQEGRVGGKAWRWKDSLCDHFPDQVEP